MRTSAALALVIMMTTGSSAHAADGAGKPTPLVVKSYLDPGLQYFRAAESALSKAGTPLDIDILEGQWFDEKPVWADLKTLKEILNGKIVTTATRRLTEKERKSGLRDVVLGYYAAVVFAHPNAPIESIDSKKWQAVLKPGKKFKWRDIALDGEGVAKDAANGALDAQVAWSFPDATYAAFAKPFVRIGAISEALIKTFPKETPELTPIATTYLAADHKNYIGIYGYNLVLENQIHPLKPVRLLKVDGVYPNDRSIADGSYPFTAPVTMVYSAKTETAPGHPVSQVLSFLRSQQAVAAAQQRNLVRSL